jgi:large subunit ribosomal protein L9
MQVILLERIEKLGYMGEVVTVKPGFARNYLLPQKKALRATKSNVAAFETQRAQMEVENIQRREEAEAVAEKINGLQVVMTRQASEASVLYGSVSARDIADGVTSQGFTINRGQVPIDKPIKTLGIHDARVRLHPEVSAFVKVNIAKSVDEAELQWQTFMKPAVEEVAPVVEEETAVAEEAPAEEVASEEEE